MQLAVQDYSFKMHLMPLAGACRDAGYDVLCCGSPGPFVREIRSAGFRYLEAPFTRSARILRQARAVAWLVRVLRRERVDILHSHTAVAGIVGRLAARLAGVRLSIYTAHGFHFHERMPALPFAFFAAVERFGGHLGDFVFVQNESDRMEAVRLRLVPRERILTIGSGIDLDRFERNAVASAKIDSLRSEFGLSDGDQVLTIIARPTANKGLLEFHEMAIQIASECPRARFLCVLPRLSGERGSVFERLEASPIRGRLVIAAGSSGGPPGHRDDIPSILALTDIFVLPSRFEGLSRVIMEAMAMGCPVVTTDVRGCRELVEDGESGRVVPNGDTHALVGAVRSLMASAAERRQMGVRSRQIAQARFGAEQSIRMQVKHIDRLWRDAKEAA